MEPYFDTGPYVREVTTKSKEAEVWFNRGLKLVLCLSSPKEALRCFDKVIELDPDCAMGYWGVAYATGLRIIIFHGKKCHHRGVQVP